MNILRGRLPYVVGTLVTLAAGAIFLSASTLSPASRLPKFNQKNVESNKWYSEQEILTDCPRWTWTPAQWGPNHDILPDPIYELCIDGFCAEAVDEGISCLPLGTNVPHDVTVRAYQPEEYRDYQVPEYPDVLESKISDVHRHLNADFDGDGIVGFSDVMIFLDRWHARRKKVKVDPELDFDGDGNLTKNDWTVFFHHLTKCTSTNEDIYVVCGTDWGPIEDDVEPIEDDVGAHRRR